MKKMFLLILAITIIISFFVLKNLLLPDGEIYYKTNHYSIKSEKGSLLKYQIFEKESGMIVILFENKKRIYINFNDKLIGLPENGYGNYTLKNKKIILHKETFFHKNGYLYKPMLKEIDDVNFEFNNNVLTLSCFSFLCDYGKIITINRR